MRTQYVIPDLWPWRKGVVRRFKRNGQLLSQTRRCANGKEYAQLVKQYDVEDSTEAWKRRKT